jgi:predicted alpha/beta hydrolase family esterase
MEAGVPSFLILHGFGYDGDPEHWHSRLARHLSAHGHAVSHPRLPDPEEPVLSVWLDRVAAELSALPGRDRAVVVCHSLGSLLWVHAAPRLKQPVDRLLLVSPPADEEVPEPAAEFRIGRPDVAAIRASSRAVPRVVRGELDPYMPDGFPAWVARARCETETIPGAEHLNPDDGHGPWPAVERWCTDPAARLAG